MLARVFVTSAWKMLTTRQVGTTTSNPINYLFVAGVPVNQKVLVGGVGEEADGGTRHGPGSLWEVALDRNAQSALILQGHLPVHRVRVRLLAAMVHLANLEAVLVRREGWEEGWVGVG